MRLAWCTLVLCVAGGACAGSTGNRHKRSNGGGGLFLSITGERPSDGKNVQGGPLLPVQLPIQLGGHGGVTLPVLVLPVPVYTQKDTCDAPQHHHQPAPVPETPNNPPYVAIRQQFTEDASNINNLAKPEVQQPQNNFQLAAKLDVQPPQTNFNFNPPRKPEVPQPQNNFNFNPPRKPEVQQPQANFNFNFPTKSTVQQPQKNVNFNVAVNNEVPFQTYGPPAQSPDVNVNVYVPVIDEPIPYSKKLFDKVFETSEQILQSFRRQAPIAPELPAILPGRALPDRLPIAALGSQVDAPYGSGAPPPRPRFDRSLHLRVDLTVPRADYTEAFETEWHSDSQTARTVVEDGSTVFYQAALPDSRVQFLEIRTERSADSDQVVRRCTLSPLMDPTPSDWNFPGLPEMSQFEFAGYTSAEGESYVERWRRVVAGGPGEGGAAQGEALTVTHEMLVIRDDGNAVPLRYSVVTDSSLLGPGVDSYTHRYRVLRSPASPIKPDTSRECDVIEEMPQPHAEDTHARAEATSRFNPFKEFAMPTRDTRYDSVLEKYKHNFQRQYIDPVEEAVRKTLLTQQSRFIAAGNRIASTFTMAANFLADRLDDELELLLGVQPPADGAAELGLIPFPYSEKEIEDLSGKLEDEFDWRPRGAVSPVRFQGTTCSSCWAFAVAGATEGALFKKTKRLVPLSPQCLVDCGRPYGANGCNGTWPSYAYDYVQDRGLPAWDEYTDYQAKVLECKDRVVPPVTHISAHVNVTANSEPALKIAIRKHAPNVVIVDGRAKSFILYKEGVLMDKRCGQTKPALNHAVLAVGYGSKPAPYFTLKNSWTAKWGEQGFVRVHPAACAVLQRPSYPLLNKPNIDRSELKAAADSVTDED